MGTSTRFTLDVNDAKEIGKVVLWTAASGAVAALIVMVGEMEVKEGYVLLVPVVNVFLYALKAFLATKTQ